MYLITTELYKKSDSDIYLVYYHIGISNFFATSFIEFHFLGESDTIIRCILLLFGKGCIIYFMGNLLLIFLNYSLKIGISLIFML